MSSTVDALAVQVRGHADQRADGDHAGAAHAGDEDAPRAWWRQPRRRQGRQRGSIHRAARPLRTRPPSMVTKLGQKPFMHEKSLLQADWSICRLRPNSVSTGRIAMQLDSRPQSPQPSHTASLMKTRVCGSVVPRFGGGASRRRRSGRTPAPTRRQGAQLALDHFQLVPVADRHPVGMSATCQGRSVPSVTSTMLPTPSACSWRQLGTVSSPSTGWPPVIATASLKRIL
jgi:hypothetical protein